MTLAMDTMAGAWVFRQPTSAVASVSEWVRSPSSVSRNMGPSLTQYLAARRFCPALRGLCSGERTGPSGFHELCSYEWFRFETGKKFLPHFSQRGLLLTRLGSADFDECGAGWPTRLEMDTMAGRWTIIPDARSAVTNSTGLDFSQLDALRHVLTSELAVIQGPPETSKTFTSISALQVLLSNIDCSKHPIIIAAQTNHALDQILVLLAQATRMDFVHLQVSRSSTATLVTTVANGRYQAVLRPPEAHIHDLWHHSTSRDDLDAMRHEAERKDDRSRLEKLEAKRKEEKALFQKPRPIFIKTW